MWECMVLAFKVAIGGILWTLLGSLIVIMLGGIFYIANKEKINEKKKPKWDGKPIVVQGEKKNE